MPSARPDLRRARRIPQPSLFLASTVLLLLGLAALPATAQRNAAVAIPAGGPSGAVVTGTKTVAGTFSEGQQIVYTIDLTNSGPGDQADNPGDELTDAMPAGVTIIDVTSSNGQATWDVATNVVHWNGPLMKNDGAVGIVIFARIDAGTFGQTLSNQATIYYDADGDGTNESTALTDDPAVGGTADPTSFVVLSPASVSGTKSVGGDFRAGGTVTYTVTLVNNGANPQQDNPGDEFTDVLPAALELTGATADSGAATVDLPSRTVHWNGTIPRLGTVTITITATVRVGFEGTTVSNQGTIHYDADGDGTNELTVVTDDPGTPAAGDATAFVVTSLAQVPTLSAGGLVLLALLLTGVAWSLLRRRRTV